MGFKVLGPNHLARAFWHIVQWAGGVGEGEESRDAAQTRRLPTHEKCLPYERKANSQIEASNVFGNEYRIIITINITILCETPL